MNINSCTPLQEGTQPIFISTERGCKHIGINANQHTIRHFKVDGDVIPKNSPEERCDYLLLNDIDGRAYYIELKGSDIEKAIHQIENSIRLLHFEIRKYTIYPRIIYRSGTHGIQGSAATKWKAKYQKRAVIHSRQYSDRIS